MRDVSWIVPDWPAPNFVKAVATTRIGGGSVPPYDSLNLGLHVGDDPQQVQQNRAQLRSQLALPDEPIWLQQVHGVRVVDSAVAKVDEEADGMVCSTPGQVCSIMTADCLPVLLCRANGSGIAALHAGWRGLADGIVQAGIEQMPGTGRMHAWLGPAIGPAAFEVGEEVRATFLAQNAHLAYAFQPVRPGHFLADLYAIARALLIQAGVHSVFGGRWCTYHEPDRFYSYRRDGVTGRMASLIWIDAKHDASVFRTIGVG